MHDEREAFTCRYLKRMEEHVGTGPLLGYLRELTDSREVLDALEQAVRDVDFFRTKRWESVFGLGLYRIVNYVLVRALRPAVFLETGVLHGLTSSFILAAVVRNGAGRLISIDYPSYFETGPANADGYGDTLPPGKEPGWVIGERYRSYWRLVLGKSLDEMPKLFREDPMIDIFLHDSEHTYATMSGEMNLAWERLSTGGVLVCDNINSNDAFPDFCRRVGRAPLLFPEGIDAAAANTDYRFGLIRR